ncbi:PadR family transcriptional regulator [Meiothermus sp. QL-1]|uniref:PadR family transcriptional regulator n=1 Tax=Meiothermus sp. QL-1 TaxID=2058095 RepID=UPI000E0A7DD5|nr:PadR family transcriptional regulator [Meiothermus sp. QL-1]RDI95491.1 PadR family transcriptional regulator [Meiothermus sp. QL-1]
MPPRLSTTDWAVLSALLEGESHGFRLAALFSLEGELGEIWRIQRPQVYRSLEHLQSLGLIEVVRCEEGLAGPPRTLFALTEAGRQAALGWLFTPVERLRYGRSDLRLKIAFLLRLGLDLRSFLQAQQAVYERILRSLEQQQAESRVRRVSLLWRQQMARASLGFVQRLLEDPGLWS